MEGKIASMVIDNFYSEVARLVVCRRCSDNSWVVCDIKISQYEKLIKEGSEDNGVEKKD